MSLETLEGLPEEVAKLYKKGDDGKFHQDLPDVTGLKSALQKERERAETAEKAAASKAKEEETARLEAERKELERKGEYDKLSAQDKARIQELEGLLKKGAEDHDAYIRRTFALTKLSPLAINERALEYLTSQLEQGIEIVQGKLLVKGDNSKPIEKLLEEITADPLNAPFLRGSGQSGPGGNPQPGGGTLATTRTRYDELMSKKEPLTRAESVEIQKLGEQIQKEQRKG